MMAEEVLNNSLGCLGDLVRDSAGATHALSCEVPAAPDVHLKTTMAVKPRMLRGRNETLRPSVLSTRRAKVDTIRKNNFPFPVRIISPRTNCFMMTEEHKSHSPSGQELHVS